MDGRLTRNIVQYNSSFMAHSQRSTTVAIFRGILGPVLGQEGRFAELAGRSISWVKKVSAGVTPLSEEAALDLEKRTGISAAWLLEGETEKPAVSVSGGRFDVGVFEDYRANGEVTEVSDLGGVAEAIAEIEAAAQKKGKGSLFNYRVSRFLKECGEEFGMMNAETKRRTKPVVNEAPWGDGLDVRLL